MRYIILILTLLFLTVQLSAQEDEPTPYEIALERILEAGATEARELDLSNLDMGALPPEIGNLEKLETLSLNSALLESLPLEIGNLTNLLELSLADNRLTTLPPEIGNLTNLEALWLSFNSLTELPLEIGQLRNLRFLMLYENDLTSLPSQIGNLENLCLLYLQNNEIRYLPPELGNLRRLHFLPVEGGWYESSTCTRFSDSELVVTGNPLISPPPEVVEQGTPAILDYLRNRARWHLQRLLIGIVSGLGIIALTGLFLLRRRRNLRKPKQKCEET